LFIQNGGFHGKQSFSDAQVKNGRQPTVEPIPWQELVISYQFAGRQTKHGTGGL
jgi:hypothetical protein